MLLISISLKVCLCPTDASSSHLHFYLMRFLIEICNGDCHRHLSVLIFCLRVKKYHQCILFFALFVRWFFVFFWKPIVQFIAGDSDKQIKLSVDQMA